MNVFAARRAPAPAGAGRCCKSVDEPTLSLFIRLVIMFAGMLSTSRIAAALLRKIPLLARMI